MILGMIGRYDVVAYYSHRSRVVKKPIGVSIYAGGIKSKNLLWYGCFVWQWEGRAVVPRRQVSI